MCLDSKLFVWYKIVYYIQKCVIAYKNKVYKCTVVLQYNKAKKECLKYVQL